MLQLQYLAVDPGLMPNSCLWNCLHKLLYVTFSGQFGVHDMGPGMKMELFRNYSVVPSRFRDEPIKAVECVAGFRYIIKEAGFYSNVIPRVFDCMYGLCARFNFRLG